MALGPAPVSLDSLVKRINRKLKEVGQSVKKSRRADFKTNFGDYFLFDLQRRQPTGGRADLKDLAERLDVLHPGEVIDADA